MMTAVDLLRRVLLMQAVVWAFCGTSIAVAPQFALVTLFGLPSLPDQGFVRVAGVCSFALALLMVLVARRLAELWWFAWVFVVAAAGTAVVGSLNALFGLPNGVSPLLWWVFAAASSVFTAGLLAGLAKTGTERPAL